MEIHCSNAHLRAPAPIMFPDLISQERARAEREAARLGSASRQAEALRIATANGYEQGEQAGYVNGTRVGFWIGAAIGGLATGIVGAAVYALRAWAATL